MNRIVGVLLFVIWFVASGSALDRDAFTFTNYDLELRLAPATSGFDARGTVTLRNDSPQPQRTVVLQVSSSLAWRSVRLNDKPLALTTSPYVSDIDHTGALSEAIVTLPLDVPPGKSVQLEVSYGGTVKQDAKRLTRIGAPEEVANATEWDRITPEFTAFRGIGYVTWYPIATEAVSLSDGSREAAAMAQWQARQASSAMKLTVEMPDAKAIWMNTACVAGAQENQTTCSFANLGQYTPVFVRADFTVLQRPDITIRYGAGQRVRAEQFAIEAEKVLPFTTEWFGAPRTGVDVLSIGGLRAPFEAGPATLVPAETLNTNIAPLLAGTLFTRNAVASHRRWINEGLAQFSSPLWIEHADGRPMALAYLARFRAPLADAEKRSGSDQNEPLAIATDPLLFRFKATYVWWMLREMVGDDALKKVLSAYHADEDKDPAYVQRLVRRFVPQRDLEWFFDDWVYRDRGLPDFRVESAVARPLLNANGSAQGFTITVTVENLGGAGAELPVTVRTTQGDVTQKLEVRAKAKAVTRIQVPAEPTDILLNDGSVPESDLKNNAFHIAK